MGLLVDPGFLALMYALSELIRQFRRSSKSRLELSFSGRSENLEVHLRLFRPDYYEIKLTRMPESNRRGWHSRGSLGTWTRHCNRIELVSHTDKPEDLSRAVLDQSLDQIFFEVIQSTYALPGLDDAPELPPVSFRLKI